MASQDENLSFQQLSVLDLLKSHIQSQKDAIATLENKAQRNFTIINIITGIVAALNLNLVRVDALPNFVSERPTLVLIFVGYVIVVVLSLGALVIRKQASVPMTVSVKNAKQWSETDVTHHIDILTRSYVGIYRHNERIVKLKGRSVQWSYTTIFVVIAAIFVEVLGLTSFAVDLVQITMSALRRLAEQRHTAIIGINVLCVLFAPSVSLRFSLLSRMKAGASALEKRLGSLANRFRR